MDWGRVETVLWSYESKFFSRHLILQTNVERRTIWIVISTQFKKPESVIVWGCINAHGIGNLHIYEGAINAEEYKQVLELYITERRSGLF